LRELTTLTHYHQCWLTNETAAEGGGRSEGIDTYAFTGVALLVLSITTIA